MTVSRPAGWFLVALAVVMVLGHICASPFHAHAGALATHEQHESHHADGNSDDDAAHAGSCEVLKSASAVDRAPAVVAMGTVPVVVLPPTNQLVAADASVADESPPLFLLHSVLLI
jgi:hypothetical protein